MKQENKNLEIRTWSEIKDRVYGEKGSERRDHLERESESFRIGRLLKKARESRNAQSFRTTDYSDNTDI